MATSTKTTSNSADDCLQAIARGLSSPRLPQPGPVMDQTLQYSAAVPAPETELLRWHPPCDHSAMAVIYREDFRCSSCGRLSPFGWLYRCVADTDPLLLGARDKGDPVAFDDIGRQFADQMSLGKFGPDRRSKEDNILDEMSPEQFCSYTPEQLDTLLSQRENVSQPPPAVAVPLFLTYHPGLQGDSRQSRPGRLSHRLFHGDGLSPQ
jgi:hypothetical protein